MITVFLILGGAAVLFASNRLRPDVVALLTVLALMLTKTLTPRESLAGFGDPVVIQIACLLVLGAALTRTGVASVMSRGMIRTAGNSEIRMIIVITVATCLLGAIMNGTAVVAILIPAVLAISRSTGIQKSRLLIPLVYASMISGMLTLIATTANLIVSAELVGSGHEGFDFFDFTPIGLAVVVAGTIYMLLIGRRLLPKGEERKTASVSYKLDDLSESYGLRATASRLRISADSPLIDASLRKSDIHGRYGAWIFLVERRDRFGLTTKAAPSADFVLRAGDVLVTLDRGEGVDRLAAEGAVERLASEEHHRRRWFRDAGLAVVMIHPQSRLIEQSVTSSRFRKNTGLITLGLRRRGEVLDDHEGVQLRVGDELLVIGNWDQIARLRESFHDFVVLTRPSEIADVAPARRQLPVAVAILVGMVLLAALEIVPVVVAIMLATMGVVAARCLSMGDAYRAINWSSLVLIGGMLPAADALAKTGGIDFIVNGLTDAFGDQGPYVMMSVLFFITAGLGLFFSASAVLMAPVAIGAASAMGIEPHAFAMTVAIAASSAFATPFLSASANMVMTAGDYKFSDFVKVGVPMVVLAWLVSMLLIPRFFAF